MRIDTTPAAAASWKCDPHVTVEPLTVSFGSRHSLRVKYSSRAPDAVKLSPKKNVDAESSHCCVVFGSAGNRPEELYSVGLVRLVPLMWPTGTCQSTTGNDSVCFTVLANSR